jgi:hypothetical protein
MKSQILLGLLLILALASCENNIGEVKDLFDYPDPNIEVVVEPKIVFSDSAKVQARITAPIMHRESSSGVYGKDIFPDGVKAKMYNKDGKISSWLNADYGENRRKTNEIMVERNVLLYNTEGDTLRAEELIWDQEEHLLHTDKFVRMTSEGQLIYGFGFRSREDFSEWEIKAFKGMVEVDE